MARQLSRIYRLSQRISVAVAIAMLVLVGCGASKGNVKGVVFYKDKALASGVVTFVAAKGSVSTASIQPDGSYTLKNVPAGEVTILVTSGPGLGGKGKAVPIPKDYSDPAKSPLKYTVTSGDQEHDIRLK